MSKAVKLRVAYDLLGLALVAAKMGADVYRHGSHKDHSQRCSCLLNCYGCVSDAIRELGVQVAARRMAERMERQMAENSRG